MREAGVPVTEFRAAAIIGSGSLSFEMVRYLTERLPFMIAPKWIVNEVQPIAVRDVLTYLMEARAQQPSGIVEIGGADRLSFRESVRSAVASVLTLIDHRPGFVPMVHDQGVDE